MLLWRRAILLGVLSWAVLFAIGFAAFPLKLANRQLFETAMYLATLLVAGVLMRVYFRERPVGVPEAVLVGFLWLACNLVLDYPMFARGPMQMTAEAYYSEIGLDYLTFPAFGFGAARLAAAEKAKAAAA